MHIQRSASAVALGAAALLVACGGGKPPAGGESAATSASPPPAPAAETPAGPQTPDAGGKVITVELITDETGNYFKPKKLEAHQGDVIRYTLTQGVHNVDFLPDSNPGKAGLPKASDLLQLPGQTFDVKVTFAPGQYYFQCDPHAALGMRGRLDVEKAEKE
jgi:plastocyanin